MDFNADGHLDYLTATFAGYPYVSYGSKAGYGKPQLLKDADGKPIIISSYWNYEAEQHQSSGRSMPGGKDPGERCISALAFDWDGDGDFDLLLGSYENGHLYRQMNEGSNAKPAFTGRNIPVMAGNKPFALKAKMTTPRLVDWDKDGDMDLVAGTFGDSWGNGGMGGGVYLSLNTGKSGAPEFGPLSTLIAPRRTKLEHLSGPIAGLYPDVADIDGDDELDLIVGGYSMWTPKGRKLSVDEKNLVKDLKAQHNDLLQKRVALSRERNAAIEKATAGLKRPSEAYKEKRATVAATFNEKFRAISQDEEKLMSRLSAYEPSKQRKPFVWFYKRRPQTGK